MVAFAALMVWLTQPTVIPNAPYDLAGAERRTPIILRAASAAPAPDLEQAAIAMAAQENTIQGLRPIAVAAAEPHTASVPPAAQVAAKPAKPKRAVARAPRRETGTAFASSWWGGGGHSMFGGGGGWYR